MHPPVTMNDQVVVSEIFSSIQGEGYLAGRRQIFIRLAGCNLDCSYCDTVHAGQNSCRIETGPGSAEFSLLQQPLQLDHVLQIVQKWCTSLPWAHHSISLTGGEPLIY